MRKKKFGLTTRLDYSQAVLHTKYNIISKDRVT